jgi:hypothetical protein
MVSWLGYISRFAKGLAMTKRLRQVWPCKNREGKCNMIQNLILGDF